jgi:hypothetical protein
MIMAVGHVSAGCGIAVQTTYAYSPLREGKFKATSYLTRDPLLQVTLNFLSEEPYQLMISLHPINVVPTYLTI